MRGKKGQITPYIVFIIMSLTIITLGAVFSPMGTQFSTQLYAAGESVLLKANESIAQIQDENVKARFYESVGNALDSQEQNVSITTGMYQYSWIIVLVLAGLVLFLFTRSIVEYTGGGVV